jgi:hypothetical protein
LFATSTVRKIDFVDPLMFFDGSGMYTPIT